jgi:hypothetical protein
MQFSPRYAIILLPCADGERRLAVGLSEKPRTHGLCDPFSSLKLRE